jgi:hypothetical protein
MPRSYSPQQMEEILRRAMQREAAGEISHTDLLEAAQEVGIDPGAVEAAALELDAEEVTRQREARIRSELRKRALGAFGNYLVINALVFTVDALSGPERWFHWVLLGTTALLLRRLFLSLFPGEVELARADKRLKKREDRELKHRDRARWQRNRDERKKQTAAQFERAVEEGVQALFKVAADKLEHYNQAGGGPGPRVRVEPVPGVAREAHERDTQEHGEEAPRSRGGPPGRRSR